MSGAEIALALALAAILFGGPWVVLRVADFPSGGEVFAVIAVIVIFAAWFVILLAWTNTGPFR